MVSVIRKTKQDEDEHDALIIMNKALDNEHKTFGSLIIEKLAQIISKNLFHPKPNRTNKRVTS